MTQIYNNFARLMMVFLAVAWGMGTACRGDDLIKGEIVSVGIGGVNGKGGVYRAGCWVPVRVRVENRSGTLLEGRLAVQQIDLDGDKVLSMGPDVILQAGDVEGRDFWMYYWPRPDDELRGIKGVLLLDKTGSSVRATIPAAAAYDSVGLGLKDDADGRSMRWVVVLGPDAMGMNNFNGAFGGTEAVRVVGASSAAAFPDNVLGLDGVDTVVWEADKVRPSDLPPDFQLKALLDWVQSGGHLIITVGTQGQEFLKNGERLSGALPMTFTSPRQVSLDELKSFPGLSDLRGKDTVTQLVGNLKEGARVISPGAAGLQDHPLAVTGLYGRGAVTVVTVDMGNPLFAQTIQDEKWLDFWNQAGGWSATKMLTKTDYERGEKVRGQNEASAVFPTPHYVQLGSKFPDLVDVTEVTQIRLLVAVLFLAVYWLAAGPIGHIILKIYKVVHWSWWIFGATVVLAGGVAGIVVLFLQLTNYDLRHKTFVLGTVNSKDVTAVGFYGVFAPKSGLVQVSQPGSGGSGMNYLAPLNMFTIEPVKPFADPDSYALFDEKPEEASPVFRNTLKKMQGRWTGTLDGVTGVAKLSGDRDRPLDGSLVNNSGYDLSNVEIVLEAATPTQIAGMGRYYVYDAGSWKAGAALDLSSPKTLHLVTLNLGKVSAPEPLSEVLRLLAHEHEEAGHDYTVGLPGSGKDVTPEESAVVAGRSSDLLFVLLDARGTDPLNDEKRVEAERSLSRATDATKMLYAAGGLIVAKAGDVGMKDYVKSPVPITVNGRLVEGRGEVTFAWALPVSGKPLVKSLVDVPVPGQENGGLKPGVAP